MNKNEILHVHHLSVQLDHEYILENITFSLKEHEILVILGPNGAGKTTLLRTLAGLIPFSGTIDWKTKKISYLPPQEYIEKKDIPPITVKEFFSIKKLTENEIIEDLKSVKLNENFLHKELSKLSTGEFQRLLLAWALVDKSDVILLDEPTSSIDIHGQETILDLLKSIWEKTNISIILITHDLNLVWKYASKVMCLNKKIICIDSPHEISKEVLEKTYGKGIGIYEHKLRS